RRLGPRHGPATLKRELRVARIRPQATSRPGALEARRGLGRRHGPATLKCELHVARIRPKAASGTSATPDRAPIPGARWRPGPGCASLTRATAHAERSPNKAEGRIAPLRDRSATTPGRRHALATSKRDSPRSPDKAGGRIREPHHAHHLRPSVAHVRPDPGCASLTRATAHAERSPNKAEGRIAPL